MIIPKNEKENFGSRLFEFNLIPIERKIKIKVAILKPETARHFSETIQSALYRREAKSGSSAFRVKTVQIVPIPENSAGIHQIRYETRECPNMD